MSRSKNIDTYSAAERGLLHPDYIAVLPQTLPPFPTRRAAMGARIALYGLIGAARRSDHTHERVASYQLGISMPVEQPDGTWVVTLFNKDEGGAPSPYQSAIEHALRSTIGAVPQPPLLRSIADGAVCPPHNRRGAADEADRRHTSDRRADVGGLGAPVPAAYAIDTTPATPATPAQIEAAVRAAGLLGPDDAFDASEWTQQTATGAEEPQQ